MKKIDELIFVSQLLKKQKLSVDSTMEGFSTISILFNKKRQIMQIPYQLLAVINVTSERCQLKEVMWIDEVSCSIKLDLEKDKYLFEGIENYINKNNKEIVLEINSNIKNKGSADTKNKP